MPPYPKEPIPTGVLTENDALETDKIPQNTYVPDPRPVVIVWKNVIAFAFLHCVAVYGVYLAFTSAKWHTLILGFILYNAGAVGVTGGAHRLWCHKGYKAKWPLKLFMVIIQTIAHQNSVIEFSRDHRVHHKYQETDADPHNAKRGFVFAHVGWLCTKKHEQVKIKGQQIDMSDLYAEPMLRIQHKYFFTFFMPMACFILPTVLPMLLWNETFINAFSVNVLRYVLCLQAIWCVNSVAHMWGNKPYDKNINPVDSGWVSFFAGGEGWHNYHHTFPWDYKAAEFGWFNLSMLVINLFAKIGWAYDLKTVSNEMIKHRVMKHGDGSHAIWGWGDKEQTKENYEAAVIYNPKRD